MAKGGIGGTGFSLTELMVAGALLSPSGKGGGKPSGGGGDEGCWQALAIPFGIAIVYYVCYWIGLIIGFVGDHPWWFLFVVLVIAAVVGIILFARGMAVKGQQDRQGKFMDDFRRWEAGRRAVGDNTRYCVICRGWGCWWAHVGGNYPHDQYSSCPGCGGNGVRHEDQIAPPFMGWPYNFPAWVDSMDDRRRSGARCIWCNQKNHTHCPWCRPNGKAPTGMAWFSKADDPPKGPVLETLVTSQGKFVREMNANGIPGGHWRRTVPPKG